jgi:hypothetical protein
MQLNQKPNGLGWAKPKPREPLRRAPLGAKRDSRCQGKLPIPADPAMTSQECSSAALKEVLRWSCREQLVTLQD